MAAQPEAAHADAKVTRGEVIGEGEAAQSRPQGQRLVASVDFYRMTRIQLILYVPHHMPVGECLCPPETF
jgi:hypothetical protein